jgi:hypothetical protein
MENLHPFYHGIAKCKMVGWLRWVRWFRWICWAKNRVKFHLKSTQSPWEGFLISPRMLDLAGFMAAFGSRD